MSSADVKELDNEFSRSSFVVVLIAKCVGCVINAPGIHIFIVD